MTLYKKWTKKKYAMKFYTIQFKFNSSILLNKYMFLYDENFSYLNISKRSFSFTSPKFSSNSSDIDKIFDSLAKHQQEFDKLKKELDEMKEQRLKEHQAAELEKQQALDAEKQAEQDKQDALVQEQLAKQNKTFLDESEDKVNGLMENQSQVENSLIERLTNGYSSLGGEKAKEIHPQYGERCKEIKNKIQEKAFELEEEFKGERSVAYFQKKVDIQTAGFKKITQIFEKEEEQVDKELRKKASFEDYKEEYDKERSKWKQELTENIRACRQEKKDVKESLNSRLEKASEMAESLLEESGPDYTGGDD